MRKRPLLVFPGLFFVSLVLACQVGGEVLSPPIGPVACEGTYAHHLQGVCTDRVGSIYWCFTTDLIKTDSSGKVVARCEVPDHHGDLSFVDGRIYVAVFLGKFNEPAGQADSWIYVYGASNLDFIAKHPVPEVVHGAGGMDSRDGHFFVIGGLPEGVAENFVYEYDSDFRFLKRHVVASGWTKMGIQTASWHDGAWWFGCYGSPEILLKADGDFRLLGRYEFDCSLGIAGTGPGRFLVANGPRSEGLHRGELVSARPDEKAGLSRLAE